MNRHHKNLEMVVLTIISLVFIMWSSAFIYHSSFITIDGKRYFCLFDDAMISMRYAWNFSHGAGLVWNQGEYVQGYTHLLMTLLMSFVTLMFDKSTAVLVMQILGMGFMLAIAYVTMNISSYILETGDSRHQTLVRILSFCCALFYYPLAYWSLMGMETGLLTLLSLLGILSAFKYVRSANIIFLFLTSLFFGLAFLTRNDSIIVSVLVWIYIFWETPGLIRSDLRNLPRLLGPVGLFLLFIVGQLVFQELYYGTFLPNTYTLKLIGMPLPARLINGIEFVTPFLIAVAFILVLSTMEVLFDFQKRKLLLLLLVFSGIGYQVYVGGDPWDYWRMMSPSMPLLTLLFIVTVNSIVLAISETQAYRIYFLRNPLLPAKHIPQILIAFLTAIGLLTVNARFVREITFLDKPYATTHNQINVNIAIALNQLTTGQATIGVYWAGAIPYYSDRRAIDFLGKSDRYIAQLPPDMSGKVAWLGMNSVPGHNKYDLDYSIKILKPTYVQGFEWGRQDLTRWAASRYVQIEYDGISLYLQKDSPAVLWNKINIP
jgi:arabinofuranosyltransferase